MYQVGFGDCFLLSFGYPSGPERHMLIDIGTTRRREGGPTLPQVAASIAERTSGSLDVLVVSHRHRDHLSGFGVDASAEIISKLSPRLLVLPWTEDPKADDDASKPSGAVLRGLSEGRSFAAAIDEHAPKRGTGSRSELVRAAREEVANAEAVEWLKQAARKADAEYLHVKVPSRIRDFIEGVKITVLGPPKPEDWPEVQEQRADHPEYWMLGRRLLQRSYSPDLAKRLYGQAQADVPLPTNFGAADPPPGPDRWIAACLRRHEMVELTTIVRWLDEALNNTSLILLIEAADKRMLFCGDAQIENWGWVLDQQKRRPALRRALSEIDLVKVGHHGSRNGTPRSLHALWVDTSTKKKRVALLSTRKGVHGKTEATAVPRITLLQALSTVAKVYSTDTTGELFVEAVGQSGVEGFSVSGAAPLSTETLLEQPAPAE